MAEGNTTQFFLGSNSGCGFYSYFDAFYDPTKMRRVFLLKGGAGNGKSTLMKKIARAAALQGLHTEQIRCPSDPNSLDAVRVVETGVAVIDATPPHAREAEFHGLPEYYISLSPYIHTVGLEADRAEVMELTASVKECHAAARKRLAAAYSVSNSALALVLDGVHSERLSKRGAALARRYIPKRHGVTSTKARKRFLSAVTPRGLVACIDTPQSLCGNPAQTTAIAVHDRFGLSPFVLSPLLEEALQNGYETYACYSPLVPSCLTGVIVPELSLFAAVAEHGFFDTYPHCRNLRLNDAVDPDVLRQSRSRLRILRQAEAALIDDACDTLAEALRYHDALEAVYKRHTDYSGLDRLAEILLAECLA